MNSAGRTLVIGLDGCSWNVLEPLLASGRLPHLSALRDAGASGVLESTIPFFTGPAWASYATGCAPPGHGIWDFMMLRDEAKLSVATDADLRCGTYLDVLRDEGRRSIVINLPIDRQRGIEGTLVQSWLTDDPKRRVLPPERAEDYAAELEEYRTFPVNPGDVDELIAMERARGRLANAVLEAEQWDHAFVLFSSTDWLAHSAIGSALSGDPEALEAFLRLYEEIDHWIGLIVDQAPDATVIVLSDHGQCAEDTVFRVNAVLERLGLVERTARPDAEESPFFVDRRPQPRARMHVPQAFATLRGNRVLRPVALKLKRGLRRLFGVEITAPSAIVDKTRSLAFCPTDAAFAIHCREGEEIDLGRVREALLNVRLPDGRAAIDGVWGVEELFGRPRVAGDPTLLFAPARGVRPSAGLKDRVLDFSKADGRGCHQRAGIVIVAGPGVTSCELEPASICDITPTLLWAMGCPIPDHADGVILRSAFTDEFAAGRELRSRPVPAAPTSPYETDAEMEEVENRLRALGYL